jgi:hypothetical protein
LQRDVMRAGARALGGPNDVIEMLTNAWLSGNEKYNPLAWPRGSRLDIPGSQELIDIGERWGAIPTIEGETPLDRLSSSGVEEGLTALGLQGALSPLAKLRSPVMKKLFGWGENPARTAGTVTGLGTTSGMAGEAAAGIDPSLRPYGMLAGVLSPLAIYGLAKQRRMASPLNPEQQKRVAGQFLQENVSDVNAVLGTTPSDYGVPGFTSTMGRYSGDPGLLRAEKGLVVSDPTFANMIDDMQTQNREAMRGAVEQVAPSTNPDAMTDFARSRAAVGAARRQKALAKAKADAEALTAPLTAQQQALAGQDTTLTPSFSREEASAAVEAAMVEAKASAKDHAGQLYQLADQYSDTVVPVDTLMDLRNSIQADAVRRGLTSELPKLLSSPVDDTGARIADVTLDDFLLSGAGKNVQGLDELAPIMSLARLEGLRGLIKKRLRDLSMAGQAETQEGRYLGQLAGGIDDIFNNVADQAYPWVPPEAAKAYDAARSFYGKSYKPTFGGKTPIGRGLAANQPTTFLGGFIKKGEKGGVAADALLKAGADIEDGVRDYMLNYVNRVATKNGKLDPAKLANFNADYAPFLDRFPGVKKELLDAQSAQAALNAKRDLIAQQLKDAGKEGDELIKAAERRAKELDSSLGRSKWAARYFLDKDPQHAVRSVLASPDQDKAIAQTLGLLKQDKSGDALIGFQRAYMDDILSRITQQVETPGVKAGALTKIIDREQKFLQAFLSPKQVDALHSVLKAANVDLRQARRAAIAGGSGTPEGLQAANVINELVSLKLGGPFTRRVLWLFDRTGMQASQQAVQLLLREAMMDPQVLKELLTIPVKPGLNLKVPQHLGNALGRISSAQEAGEAP